jgi:hypothetical protein
MKESYFVNKSIIGLVPHEESIEEEGSKDIVQGDSNLSFENYMVYKMHVLY